MERSSSGYLVAHSANDVRQRLPETSRPRNGWGALVREEPPESNGADRSCPERSSSSVTTFCASHGIISASVGSSSLVNVSVDTSSRPGIGGLTGDEPVARTQRCPTIRLPATRSERSSMNSAPPRSKVKLFDVSIACTICPTKSATSSLLRARSRGQSSAGGTARTTPSAPSLRACESARVDCRSTFEGMQPRRAQSVPRGP